MSENKFWAIQWVIGFFVVIWLIACITFYNTKTEIKKMEKEIKMAELGYQQELILGYTYPVWKRNE